MLNSKPLRIVQSAVRRRQKHPKPQSTVPPDAPPALPVAPKFTPRPECKLVPPAVAFEADAAVFGACAEMGRIVVVVEAPRLAAAGAPALPGRATLGELVVAVPPGRAVLAEAGLAKEDVAGVAVAANPPVVGGFGAATTAAAPEATGPPPPLPPLLFHMSITPGAGAAAVGALLPGAAEEKLATPDAKPDTGGLAAAAEALLALAGVGAPPDDAKPEADAFASAASRAAVALRVWRPATTPLAMPVEAAMPLVLFTLEVRLLGFRLLPKLPAPALALLDEDGKPVAAVAAPPTTPAPVVGFAMELVAEMPKPLAAGFSDASDCMVGVIAPR